MPRQGWLQALSDRLVGSGKGESHLATRIDPGYLAGHSVLPPAANDVQHQDDEHPLTAKRESDLLDYSTLRHRPMQDHRDRVADVSSQLVEPHEAALDG